MKKTPGRKSAAQTFLRLCATGKVREAYERFAAPGFIPQTSIKTQRVLEQGNLVAVHSRVRHSPQDADIAVVHIFRFKGARVAELWDIAMQVPKDSPNAHGAF